uniref:(California timema) hypothetical protein n=1 Tax=Timema californicum TaxID=61474 RepID=A0A7R9J100_TIMCA|nr:unnamed protein product [Timema californicum]
MFSSVMSDNLSSPIVDMPCLEVRFTRWQPLGWLNPDNWKGLGETEERYNPMILMDFVDLHFPIRMNLSSPANPAIPHSDKVPCETDAVVFPGQSSFSIRLPETRVSIGRMYFNQQRRGKTPSVDLLNKLQRGGKTPSIDLLNKLQRGGKTPSVDLLNKLQRGGKTTSVDMLNKLQRRGKTDQA